MARGLHFQFSSAAPPAARKALKELLFLHPYQPRDEEGILAALRAYGQPVIEETAGQLRIRVGELVPQCLFAFDEADPGGNPVGVVLFSRSDPATIFIIHVVVHPDYAMHGRHADLGLGVALIEQVQAIAARLTGIQKVKLSYRRNIELRV